MSVGFAAHTKPMAPSYRRANLRTLSERRGQLTLARWSFFISAFISACYGIERLAGTRGPERVSAGTGGECEDGQRWVLGALRGEAGPIGHVESLSLPALVVRVKD
jgi:hypothetical protein